MKASLPVFSITDETAELIGKIGAESSTAGLIIPLDDLLVRVH